MSKRTLQIVLDADQAMALLLNMTIAVDHTAALERLINGELVRQAAQPTGFRLAEATIQQSLQAFLMANQKDDADLERALLGASVTRADFIDYFSRLLLIDRFVRKEATQRKITDAAYLQQLQQAAHISFGPAAASSLDGRVDIPRNPNPAIATGTSTVAASDVVPFALPLLNDTLNQTLTLNSLLGHPTVLSFWTTWCPYCKKQLPLLVAAQAQYAQQGIQFVGIAVKDSPASVQTYIAENQIRYPIPLDADGRVANTYNVHGFPTTLFLDAQGHVVARQIGALSAEKLREEIQQLLKN
ncbi:MAG: TlpA disulfide reductase family protein [Chloroflexi bacterium]|nr:TlpA disulfide reductase family protein [Chloroflexota bacterium]